MKRLYLILPAFIFSFSAFGGDNQPGVDRQTTQRSILPGGCVVEDEIRTEQIGLFSRLSCLGADVIDATQDVVVWTYKTFNRTVYLVGFTTLGIVIYSIHNGELKTKVINRTFEGFEDVQEFLWQVEGLPFGSFSIGLPSEIVKTMITIRDGAQAVVSAGNTVGEHAETIGKQLSDAAENKNYLSKTRQLFRGMSATFNESLTTLTKSLGELRKSLPGVK